jgi:hypothetical protein
MMDPAGAHSLTQRNLIKRSTTPVPRQLEWQDLLRGGGLAITLLFLAVNTFLKIFDSLAHGAAYFRQSTHTKDQQHNKEKYYELRCSESKHLFLPVINPQYFCQSGLLFVETDFSPSRTLADAKSFTPFYITE